MIKAVVFDMDGVLFDTEHIGNIAWKKVAGQMQIHDIEEVWRHSVGLNRNDEIIFLEKRYGEDFPVDQFLDRCGAGVEEIIAEQGLPLKKGVREILDYLHQEKMPIAICSSSKVEKIKRHLKRAAIPEDLFSAVIGGDLIEHSKPAPDIYLKACEKLKMLPQHCIAVEDSPNGIRSAHAAGLQVVMVPDMIAPTEELLAMCVRKEDSLLELLQVLKEK